MHKISSSSEWTLDGTDRGAKRFPAWPTLTWFAFRPFQRTFTTGRRRRVCSEPVASGAHADFVGSRAVYDKITRITSRLDDVLRGKRSERAMLTTFPKREIAKIERPPA